MERNEKFLWFLAGVWALFMFQMLVKIYAQEAINDEVAEFSRAILRAKLAKKAAAAHSQEGQGKEADAPAH